MKCLVSRCHAFPVYPLLKDLKYITESIRLFVDSLI